MRNFFYFIIFFLILFILSFLFYLTEKNRTKTNIITIYDYYTDFNSILLDLTSELFKLYDKEYTFPVNNLNIHKKLIENHEELLKEFENNYDKYDLINPGIFDSDFIDTTGNYGYFNIRYYGNINKNKFPILEKLIKDEENIVTCFYSIMDGEKYIPKHTGPYNGLLRYHYTLFSGNDKNDFLQVKDKKLYWLEKEGFMFDDTYEHYVDKKSESMRVALIMDIKRKLPYPLNLLNNFILKYISNNEYVLNNKPKLELKEREKIKF